MYEIVREPIDVSGIEASVRERSCGALVTFRGIVRDRAGDGRAVDGLAYEAYEPMVLEEFAQIAREARERWGEVHLAIVHRIGEVRAGEIAIAVVAAASHRAEAFAACAYAVEELKRRGQIWKKEHYADGTPDRWCPNDARGTP